MIYPNGGTPPTTVRALTAPAAHVVHHPLAFTGAAHTFPLFLAGALLLLFGAMLLLVTLMWTRS